MSVGEPKKASPYSRGREVLTEGQRSGGEKGGKGSIGWDPQQNGGMHCVVRSSPVRNQHHESHCGLGHSDHSIRGPKGDGRSVPSS